MNNLKGKSIRTFRALDLNCSWSVRAMFNLKGAIGTLIPYFAKYY